MTNTGRPSRACTACKRRKVKCDEKRPKCHSCQRLNIECAWKEVSFIRQQNQWAEVLVERRVQKGQKRRNPDILKAGISIPKQLQVGPEIYAISRFYSNYAYTSGTCPFLYLLAPLYDDTRAPACLHYVVPAVALASAARQLKRRDLMTDAHRYHGRAIKALGKGLSDPEVVKHDGTLITVFLMGLYESLVCEREGDGCISNQAHNPGRLAILRLRGPSQLRSKSGRNLFTLLRHEQLVASFTGEGDLKDEFSTWMSEHYPPTPIAKIQSQMYEVSCLISTIRKAVRRRKGEQVLALINKGMHMEEGLFQSEQVPVNWPKDIDVVKRATGTDRHSDLPAPLSIDATKHFSQNIASYVNCTQALLRNMYQTVHLHLLRALLGALPLVHEGSSDTGINIDWLLQNLWEARVRALATAICNDARAAIGEYDRDGQELEAPIVGYGFRAYLQLWPLQTALEVDHLDPQERKNIVKSLRHIHEVIGIGRAVTNMTETTI
ncbi:hypothetical protein BDV96DRAFT_694361 [Lophiotrema nucula]|uniref:Zn(2)-C6 fungal-type domain-containing protein n=1 Tax=Lophiotrema nucula TaxID=690887 RepID=A0A6A5YGN4_9PLEO|nr:hypothetical protein BDV96DRAFT_694361 [Lophiotrema nucula]